MPFRGNWDELNGIMNNRDTNYDNLSSEELKKLSRKERRKLRVQKYSARESYRNYRGKRYSYFEVVITELLCTVVGWFVLGACYFVLLAGLVGYIVSNILVGTLIVLGLSAFVFWAVFRPYLKRMSFWRKLKKICKKNNFALKAYNSPLRKARGFKNCVDFSVDTGKDKYDVMLLGVPKKHTRIRFEKPGELKIVTGYVKSRIKLIIGAKERVRVKKYGFDASPNAKKIILLSPAPREIYYYDRRDGKVVMGGSGAEFFEYSAFTGTAFINYISREAEK